MPNTYTELLKTTVGTATSSVTFDLTGISGYTDLVIIGAGSLATASTLAIRFNGDTASNYSRTEVYGDGSTAASYRESNQSNQNFALWDTVQSNFITHIQNYSNATTFKTCITRYNRPSSIVAANVVLWRKTPEAITSITITGGSNIAVGSTFSLYGIANADQGAAKATGGIITEDSQYWYHTFGASGAFIPKQSLTCDVLVVAGGGGSGSVTDSLASGAGGAGGLLAFTSQALTATSCNVTVGAGGAVNTNGVDSQFASLTLVKGGGAGGNTANSSPKIGNNGGSGGGASGGNSGNLSGGSPTSGQGTAGGSGVSGANSSDRGGGGGGGAGAAGSNAGAGTGGNGGAGLSTYSSWGLATGTGQNVNGTRWYAGGGGGGSGANTTYGTGGNGGGANGASTASNGIANTGGGAGGGASSSGGSGIVIIRYSK
jgi:hypothetical protein